MQIQINSSKMSILECKETKIDKIKLNFNLKSLFCSFKKNCSLTNYYYLCPPKKNEGKSIVA